MNPDIFENICEYNTLSTLKKIQKLPSKMKLHITEYLNKKIKQNKNKIIDAYFLKNLVHSENKHIYMLDWIGCQDLERISILCILLKFVNGKTLNDEKFNKIKDSIETLIATDVDVNKPYFNGKPPLFYAIEFMSDFEMDENYYRQIIQILINAGADVNHLYDNVTPIQVATNFTDSLVMKMLIDAGADVNLNGNNYPAIFCCNMIEEMEILINAGADLTVRNDEGETVLSSYYLLGAYENIDYYNEDVEFLINKGANINAQNTKGKTILFIACENNHERMVKLFIEKGANKYITDNTGKNPMEIAIQNNNENIIQMLK